MINSILILFIALPARYAIERVKPFQYRDRSPAWAQELKQLNSFLSNKKKTVIFNTEHPIATMFYTDCTAYKVIPSAATLDSLQNAGYTILIRDDNKLKTEKTMKGTNIYLEKAEVLYMQWP